jgi:hypothetical protein
MDLDEAITRLQREWIHPQPVVTGKHLSIAIQEVSEHCQPRPRVRAGRWRLRDDGHRWEIKRPLDVPGGEQYRFSARGEAIGVEPLRCAQRQPVGELGPGDYGPGHS